MPRVIELKDKKVETLFDVRDFEYLIERYMGYEAVDYFRELMSEKDDALKEVKAEHESEISDLKNEIRMLEDKQEEWDE